MDNLRGWGVAGNPASATTASLRAPSMKAGAAGCGRRAAALWLVRLLISDRNHI